MGRVLSRRVRDEDLDVRQRRLLFRSWHRGTQENDILLGSFAEAFLAGMDNAELDRFEALLDCPDTDLFDWVVVGTAPPPEHDHGLMQLLRDFCAGRHCKPPRHES